MLLIFLVCALAGRHPLLVPQLQTPLSYLNYQNRWYGRRDKRQEEWEVGGTELQQQRYHRR